MSDLGVAEIPVDEDERPLPALAAPLKNALIDGPILRTLLWLAWPNVIALTAGTCVVIAETSYIGRLGVEALGHRTTLTLAELTDKRPSPGGSRLVQPQQGRVPDQVQQRLVDLHAKGLPAAQAGGHKRNLVSNSSVYLGSYRGPG